MKAAFERIMADFSVKQLDKSSSLTVGDPIKVGLGLVRIGDLCAVDRMPRLGRILPDPPVLVTSEIVLPDSVLDVTERFTSTVLNRIKRHKTCESFIQPQIIPPLHSHQISKPHMSQLMKHGRRKLQILLQSTRLPPIHILFVKSDAADILHSAAVVLGRKDHIILAEGVGRPEELGVEANAGDFRRW